MIANYHYVAAALLAALLMIAEAALGRRKGKAVYTFDATVNSLSNFAGELVLTAVLRLNVFVAYQVLVAALGVSQRSASSTLTWLLALVALDFVYYWAHRAHHRVALLWALHSVHHQSNEYNVAAGLRGPWLSALQILPFMLPLALLGIPPEVLVPIYAVHTVYKLVVHTRLVDTLGPLEVLLVSPSQHRVHHGHNRHYLDKNFGGMFSVWDRAFGTFQREDEHVDFGAPCARDPLRNNVAPWVALITAASRAPGVVNKVAVLFAPPAVAAGNDAESRESLSARPIVAAAFALAWVATLLLLVFVDALPALVAWVPAIAVVTTLSMLAKRRSFLGARRAIHVEPVGELCQSRRFRDSRGARAS